jgi:hypothetical protein
MSLKQTLLDKMAVVELEHAKFQKELQEKLQSIEGTLSGLEKKIKESQKENSTAGTDATPTIAEAKTDPIVEFIENNSPQQGSIIMTDYLKDKSFSISKKYFF